jgi:hypothetical protein
MAGAKWRGETEAWAAPRGRGKATTERTTPVPPPVPSLGGERLKDLSRHGFGGLAGL